MLQLEELETLIQNRLDYVNSLKNSSSGFQIAGHGALTELMSSAAYINQSCILNT